MHEEKKNIQEIGLFLVLETPTNGVTSKLKWNQ